MKTSNYILLSLVLLFCGSLLLVAWNAEAYIKKRELDNLVPVGSALPEFSVVVAEKGVKVNLQYTADKSCNILIHKQFLKTNHTSIYEVRHDTLFIKKSPSEKNRMFVDYHEIKCLIGKPNSEVEIYNRFTNGKQLFLLDHAKLKYWYTGSDVSDAKIKIVNGKFVSDYPLTVMELVAKHSEIGFGSSRSIVDLNLNLEESYFHLEQSEDQILFNKINGIVKNNSRVDLNTLDSTILNIDLKGDKTSTFYRYGLNN